MTVADFLQARNLETKELSDIVKRDFLPLTKEVLRKKPTKNKWSIAECFEHLNLTQEVYVNQMLDAVKKKDQYPQTSEEFRLSFMGRMGVKAMQPKEGQKISYKMKTFKVLNPESSTSGDDPVGKFLNYQEDLMSVISGLKHMSLTKPKITTVVGHIFKMPIGDALYFIIAHNQRHILQAQNVLQIIH